MDEFKNSRTMITADDGEAGEGRPWAGDQDGKQASFEGIEGPQEAISLISRTAYCTVVVLLLSACSMYRRGDCLKEE